MKREVIIVGVVFFLIAVGVFYTESRRHESLEKTRHSQGRALESAQVHMQPILEEFVDKKKDSHAKPRLKTASPVQDPLEEFVADYGLSHADRIMII